ncbi:MAG: amidohydrolase family protein, partial [Chloroflexi bacterium]|nr:amidohydrolase family protein [Chloroflexota bacterium]
MTSIAADLLLDNGQVRTLHAAVPVTSALAIHNGKVLAYGDAARSLRGPATLALDLEGGLALPGFVDAHIHLLAYGLGLNEVVLAGISDYAEIERRIAQRVCTQSPGEWITGSGWNQDTWRGIQPVRALLDRLSSLHPMVFTRKDGHSIWTNSLALQRAGITAETPDPDGGRIEHLEDGTPSGILAEKAMALVLRCLPADSTTNEYRGLQRAMALANAAGITGLHDFEGAAARTAFAHALGAGALPLRVQMMIDLPAWRAGWPTEQTTNSGHPLLHTGHLK